MVLLVILEQLYNNKRRMKLAKQHLDEIINNLGNAKKYIKKAGDIAKSVGDKGGQSKIDKISGDVEKVEKEFEGHKEGR